MRRRALLAALPLSLAATPGKAQARDLDLADYVMCSVRHVADLPHGGLVQAHEDADLRRFADQVTQGSGGTLVVLVEPQVPTMPLRVIGKASALAFYNASDYVDAEPLLALSALPMLATTFDEAETLLRVARPYYEALLARHGQILLAAGPLRPAAVWSTFPIRSAADLRGTRFAYPPGVSRQTGWEKPWLRLGVVQVGYWDAELILVNGYADPFKFPAEFGCFIELFYAAQINFLTVSSDVFDSLSAAQRQLLRTAGGDVERAIWSEASSRVVREHRLMARRSVVVTAQPPADLVAALRVAAQPDIEDWVRSVGPDATAILAEYRRAVGRA